MTPEDRAAIDEHIRRVVSAAPPPTAEQAERLAALLLTVDQGTAVACPEATLTTDSTQPAPRPAAVAVPPRSPTTGR